MKAHAMAFYLIVLNTRAEKFKTVGAISMQNNDSACAVNLRVIIYALKPLVELKKGRS
jgi:hypothetical protein